MKSFGKLLMFVGILCVATGLYGITLFSKAEFVDGVMKGLNAWGRYIRLNEVRGLLDSLPVLIAEKRNTLLGGGILIFLVGGMLSR